MSGTQDGHTGGSDLLRNDGYVVPAHAGEGLEACTVEPYHAGVVLVRDNGNQNVQPAIGKFWCKIDVRCLWDPLFHVSHDQKVVSLCEKSM